MSRLRDSVRRVRRLAGLDSAVSARPGPNAPVRVSPQAPPAPVVRALEAAPAAGLPALPVAPAAPQPLRELQLDPELVGRLHAHESQGSYLVLGESARANEMPAVRRLSNDIQDRLTANEPTAASRMVSNRHPSLEFTESLGSLMSVTNPFGHEPESDDAPAPETGTTINPANFAPVSPTLVSRMRSPESSSSMSAEQHGRQRALSEGPSFAAPPAIRAAGAQERSNAVISPVQRTPAGRIRSRVSEGPLDSFATETLAPPELDMPVAGTVSAEPAPVVDVARALASQSAAGDKIAAAETVSVSGAASNPPRATAMTPSGPAPVGDVSAPPRPTPADARPTPTAASPVPSAPATQTISREDSTPSAGPSATTPSDRAQPAIARNIEPGRQADDPTSPLRAAARSIDPGGSPAAGLTPAVTGRPAEGTRPAELPTVPAGLAQRAHRETGRESSATSSTPPLVMGNTRGETVLPQADGTPPALTSQVASSAAPTTSSPAPLTAQPSTTARAELLGAVQPGGSAPGSSAARVTPSSDSEIPREAAPSTLSDPSGPSAAVSRAIDLPAAITEFADVERTATDPDSTGGDSRLIARTVVNQPTAPDITPVEMPLVVSSSDPGGDVGQRALRGVPSLPGQVDPALESASAPSRVSPEVTALTSDGSSSAGRDEAASFSSPGPGNMTTPAMTSVPRVPVIARTFAVDTAPASGGQRLPAAARQLVSATPTAPARAEIPPVRPAVALRQRESAEAVVPGDGGSAMGGLPQVSAGKAQGALFAPGASAGSIDLVSAAESGIPVSAVENSSLPVAASFSPQVARVLTDDGITQPADRYNPRNQSADLPVAGAAAASMTDSRATSSRIARADAVEVGARGVSRASPSSSDAPFVRTPAIPTGATGGTSPAVQRSFAPIPRTLAREVQRTGDSVGAAALSATATHELPAVPSISRQGALHDLPGSPASRTGSPGNESVVARMVSSFEAASRGAPSAPPASGPWSSAATNGLSQPDLPSAISRMRAGPSPEGGGGEIASAPSGPAAPAVPSEAAAESSAAATSDADVDKLADKVWTIIRHKLHIERERQRGF